MAEQGRNGRGRQNQSPGVSDETRRYDGGFLGGAQYTDGYGPAGNAAAGRNGRNSTGYTGNSGYAGNNGYPDNTGYYGNSGYTGYDGYTGYSGYGDDSCTADSADYASAGYDMDYDYNNGYDGGYDDGYDDGYDTGAGYQQGGAWYTNAGETDPDVPYREAYRRRSSGPSMAQRASGKANNEIYGRGGSRSSRAQQTGRTQSRNTARYQDDYYDDYYDEPQKPARRRREKRRKKHHPFRNFLIFLLILAAILCGAYFLLFRAPTKYEDGVHTRKSGFYNILLCATDEQGERTDTIMLLTIDQKNFTAKLTTLPRDTIVDNGDSVPKLNGVYTDAGCGDAGAEALMDQVKTLLGFRPDGYMIISYQVFKDAVDALGGVWFDVPVDMTEGVDHASVTISAGEQLLDGETALNVCRFRYGYLMQDIQRQYVQQQFIKAMIKQCLEPKSWAKLPAVYQAVMNNTITDLSGANIRFIGLWVALSYHNGLVQNTLPGEGCTYNGASCYGLYGQSTIDLVNEEMNPFEEDLTLDDVDILTVSDGVLVPSTSEGVAFDPSTYQYD